MKNFFLDNNMNILLIVIFTLEISEIYVILKNISDSKAWKFLIRFSGSITYTQNIISFIK